LDASTEQWIIAMVSGAPPEGRSRWTVRPITAEAVKRKLVPKIGRETLRMLLENHELKPWRDKNVVVRRDKPSRALRATPDHENERIDVELGVLAL
jgi:hypothetical protein